jgi:adenosylmethionine-8-amino-7-oxononanoate aminotransferase
MRSVEDVFFSGTFGGEALSLAAALATIAKLERTKATTAIHAAGRRLKQEMSAVCAEHGLGERIRVAGPDWWPLLSLAETPEVPLNLLASLLRQEAAEHGLLMLGTVNLCLAHCREGEIEELLARWRRAIAAVADHLRSNDPKARLRGEPIEPVFKVR